MLGLFLCFVGVILVAIQDEQSSDDASSGTSTLHSIGGDIVAVIGAMLYGLYTTILKLKVRYVPWIWFVLVIGLYCLVNIIAARR